MGFEGIATRTGRTCIGAAVVVCMSLQPARGADTAAGRPVSQSTARESRRSGGKHLQISGIYPHLATFNQPADVADRPNHGECGTGAIVPWAGRLWYITYPQHKTTGSNDKLYEVDPDMNLTIRPESVGGTHACRMIHRESNQLIIGPYFIDAKGNVRSADLKKLRGRMTAVMRHLTDPANKVYFFDMEGAIYEVDVHSLAVRKLFNKPVPGWHGKGGYTAQKRVVIANNGERIGAAYKGLLVGGPAVGEEAGALAEWDGKEWRIVERQLFCDVTGPGGIHGSPDDTSPLWAIGWDKRSVILKLLDGGTWYTFRLPKASHAFDPIHGWYTEWPRIRAIAPDRPMMCMHASMFDFPMGFSAKDTSGIRPICTHLRYIPDFCHWRGRVILGADDASMMANPLCGQGQSNLWFGSREQLRRFGPRAGWGGVWIDDPVRAGEPSAPYLIGGYKQRVVHLAHDQERPVRFDLEIDATGKGDWSVYRSVEVSGRGYGYHVFPADLAGEWIRVKANRDCRATAYFHYWSPREGAQGEATLFAVLADAGSPMSYAAGIIRPAAHNRSLQWLAETVSEDGKAGTPRYREVHLEGTTALRITAPKEDRANEVRKVGSIRRDFEIDAASVIVKGKDGRRYRLPKGAAAFDRPFPTGWPRAIRECVSERFLANIHGTIYEIPRGADPRGSSSPDFDKIKPVCSHDKLIADFCTWRGLLVIAGTRLDAKPDGQYFAGADGGGLWFGTIDDLWKLGKPVGRGGPWFQTPVKAGQPSDPYLMTGYDSKRMELTHDSDADVAFTVEVDFDHFGFRTYETIAVPAGEKIVHRFPDGYHAHWVRLMVDRDCTATAILVYE